MKPRLLAFLVLVAVSSPSWAAFPASLNGGSESMTELNYKTDVSLGYIAGVVSSVGFKNQIGYLYISSAAYETFLRQDHPLIVSPEPSRAAGSRYVISPDRSMRLSWSNGSASIPVQYRVYLGSSDKDLKLVTTTSDQFLVIPNLVYLADYYWQIEAFDVYGRSTLSPVYVFSIAPPVSRLYCAPNPFRAGAESSSFIFNMSGEGTATFSVYLLPSVQQVFSTTLGDLQDGVNVYAYDGRDASGRPLYNGVYMARIQTKGDHGNENQTFRFLVVK